MLGTEERVTGVVVGEGEAGSWGWGGVGVDGREEDVGGSYY